MRMQPVFLLRVVADARMVMAARMHIRCRCCHSSRRQQVACASSPSLLPRHRHVDKVQGRGRAKRRDCAKRGKGDGGGTCRVCTLRACFRFMHLLVFSFQAGRCTRRARLNYELQKRARRRKARDAAPESEPSAVRRRGGVRRKRRTVAMSRICIPGLAITVQRLRKPELASANRGPSLKTLVARKSGPLIYHRDWLLTMAWPTAIH